MKKVSINWCPTPICSFYRLSFFPATYRTTSSLSARGRIFIRCKKQIPTIGSQRCQALALGGGFETTDVCGRPEGCFVGSRTGKWTLDTELEHNSTFCMVIESNILWAPLDMILCFGVT